MNHGAYETVAERAQRLRGRRSGRYVDDGSRTACGQPGPVDHGADPTCLDCVRIAYERGLR